MTPMVNAANMHSQSAPAAALTTVIRRLRRVSLPLLVSAPFVLGWIWVWLHRGASTSTLLQAGLAALVIMNTCAFLALLWRSAGELSDAVRSYASEARFRAVVDASPLAFQLFSPDGTLTSSNRAWLTMWGLSEEENLAHIQGKFNIFKDPVFAAPEFRAVAERAFAGESVVSPPFYYDPSSQGYPGRARWLQAHFNSVRDSSGAVVEVIAVSRDLTREKEAEEHILRKSMELESILNHSAAVIFMKSPEGRYLMVNSEFERVIGLSRDQVLGLTDFDIFSEEAATWFRHADQHVLETNAPLRTEEHVPQESGLRTYLSAKFPIRDANGNIFALGGIATDITDQKRMERERAELAIREKAAQEASHLKSQFLANMSHEIRTPLNGVLGMAEVLLDSPLDSEQLEYVEAIQRSGSTLLRIVNDVLDFSKIEAKKLDLEENEFSISRLTSDVLKFFETIARKKNLLLSCELAPDLPNTLIGDPGRLSQVLMNLVSNAIKFTDKGEVKIRVNRVRENASPTRVKLRFEIHDTGIGLSPEVRDRLFCPFQQADASTTRKYGGTGLGLSISKGLVEMMGGEIGAHGLEKGSMFWFTTDLSFAGATDETNFDLSNETLERLAGGARILIVEDNSINQTIVLKMLAKLGHRGEIAANGREALQMLAHTRYDLVLMDCQMPDLDGFETTLRLRAGRSPNREIPVIAMTANAMKGAADKCLMSGMNDYLAKPVSLQRLAHTVSKWLRASPETKLASF